MEHIDIKSREPSIWPILIGLVVLALIIWGITKLVNPRGPAQPTEEVERVVEPPLAAPGGESGGGS